MCWDWLKDLVPVLCQKVPVQVACSFRRSPRWPCPAVIGCIRQNGRPKFSLPACRICQAGPTSAMTSSSPQTG